MTNERRPGATRDLDEHAAEGVRAEGPGINQGDSPHAGTVWPNARPDAPGAADDADPAGALNPDTLDTTNTLPGPADDLGGRDNGGWALPR